MTRKGSKEPKFEDISAFSFTPARIALVQRLVQDGQITLDRSNRRQWRDSETRGLVVVVSASGSASWQIYRKINGKPRRKSLGDASTVRLDAARTLVNQERYDSSIAGRIHGSSRASRGDATVKEVFDAYLQAVESGDFVAGNRKNPITGRTIKNYRELFRATLSDHKHKPLKWLATEVAAMHRRMGTGANARPYQANRMMALVRVVFEFATRERYWSGLNPCIDPITGRPLRKHPEQHRDRFVNDEEMLRLEKALDSEPPLWRDLFRFALLVGMRIGAVCRMRWSEVDLVGKVWNVPRGNMKGQRSSHGVALDAEAMSLLRDRQNACLRSQEFVFPAPHSNGTACVSTYKNAWKRICVKAGLHSADRGQRVRPHDLRRTWGTNAIASGVDIHTTNDMLGNSPNSLTMTGKVYAHVVDDHKRTAAEKILQRRLSSRAAAKKHSKRRKI